MHTPHKNDHTISFYFYNLLVKQFLPFEAKYVSLRGHKDVNLINSLIRFYTEHIIPNHNIIISEEDFNKDYLVNMEKIFLDAFLEYLDLLTKVKSTKQINTTLLPKNWEEDLKHKRNLFEIILSIESQLGLSNPSNTQLHNLLCDMHIHTDSDIYAKEFKDLIHYISIFIEAYEHLIWMIDKQEDTETMTELDYLGAIVSHEFLSALSHYASAIVYFDSPRIFINNLQRAISHLKRALMDIYDGLIMYEKLSYNIDYLRLRTQKVESLGSNARIKNLVEQLKDFYEKNSLHYQ